MIDDCIDDVHNDDTDAVTQEMIQQIQLEMKETSDYVSQITDLSYNRIIPYTSNIEWFFDIVSVPNTNINENNSGNNNSKHFISFTDINFTYAITKDDNDNYINPLYWPEYEKYYLKNWAQRLLLCLRNLISPTSPTCNNYNENGNLHLQYNTPDLKIGSRFDNTLKQLETVLINQQKRYLVESLQKYGKSIQNDGNKDNTSNNNLIPCTIIHF